MVPTTNIDIFDAINQVNCPGNDILNYFMLLITGINV
jgi:hypothetical protein